ncbi:MAG: aminoacyl-tRNA hydrolase [Pseudomonadota bacterium]|nr:aminoacyl-tRNA hydrolase [Pseudomonadota bacterium]
MKNLLIVGLGNPGKDYEETRHNVGIKFLELLSTLFDIPLVEETKFSSNYGYKKLDNLKLHLATPVLYMNESGIAIQKIKKYLKINLEDILIVHDELDLPVGKLKLKDSGGHGGHNGIRNIIDHLQGKSEFKRLRIGIDHPGNEQDVTNYVLSKGSKQERKITEKAMQNAIPIIDKVIAGKWQDAMLELHTEN